MPERLLSGAAALAFGQSDTPYDTSLKAPTPPETTEIPVAGDNRGAAVAAICCAVTPMFTASPCLLGACCRNTKRFWQGQGWRPVSTA